MSSLELGVTRLSRILFWRGMTLVLLGVAAVLWPQQMMLVAILAVGAIAVIFGGSELAVAMTLRRYSTWWPLIALHGSVVLAFGLITVGAPGFGLTLTMLLLGSWLVVYAGIAFTTGVFVWDTRPARWALFTWGIVDIVVATLVLLNPGITLIVLLISGALYAMLFGAWQMTAGLWCLHASRLVSVHQPANLSMEL